jgi:hypothetical protein
MRPTRQRAFQAPSVSAQTKRVEITGTSPTVVSSEPSTQVRVDDDFGSAARAPSQQGVSVRRSLPGSPLQRRSEFGDGFMAALTLRYCYGQTIQWTQQRPVGLRSPFFFRPHYMITTIASVSSNANNPGVVSAIRIFRETLRGPTSHDTLTASVVPCSWSTVQNRLMMPTAWEVRRIWRCYFRPCSDRWLENIDSIWIPVAGRNTAASTTRLHP